MTDRPLRTAGDALRWGSSLLREAGLGDPGREAAILLCSVLECDKAVLYAYPERKLSPGEASLFRRLIHRRCARVPLQYLTRRQEFMSLSFHVDERCFIPRPETELLVEEALKHLGEDGAGKLAVDLGTGCGCIAVSLAYWCPNLRVWACDVSAAALQVALRNCRAHKVQDRVRLVKGDLWAAFAGWDLEERVDVVVANPPYVSEEELASVQPEVRHEPPEALVPPVYATEFYRRIFEGAAVALKDGGLLLVETAPSLIPQLEPILRQQPVWMEVRVLRDLAGAERALAATRECRRCVERPPRCRELGCGRWTATIQTRHR